jgi:predicted RNase H-like HicB family nuclease
MKYHFFLHDDDDGYWAEGCELRGCLTQGDTIEEIYANCMEAMDCYLGCTPDETDRRFPLPDSSLDGKPNIIAVPVSAELETDVIARLEQPLSLAAAV